jgi:cytochrome oxidase Cu insertion factor (SCO1/SenC/PrrC family)
MKTQIKNLLLIAIAFGGVACIAASASTPVQQMEIRLSEEYQKKQFAKSKPAIGDQAPELELKTLEGEPVQLSSFRGKKIVVVKAGYT